MTTSTVSPVSKCQARNPEFCRYHGSTKKAKFEERSAKFYKNAQTEVNIAIAQGAGFYMDAQEICNIAEQEYFSTEAGEKELLAKIADTPEGIELDVLKQKHADALEMREQLEAKDAEEGVYTFPASKLPEAQNRLDKANRKLERAGLEERFTADIEHYIETDKDGNKFDMIRYQLNIPPVKVAGWDFVAAVDNMDNGSFITRVLPGQELKGYSPEKMVCDHCGNNRKRKATYLLKDAQGEYKQVGSSCLQSFLGVTPKGLWALSYDVEETERLDNGIRRRGGPDQLIPVDDTVAIALAISDGGKKFTSSSKAMEWGIESTASQVSTQLFSSTLKEKDKVDFSAYREQAKEIIKNTQFDDNSDYGSNMKKLLSEKYLSTKHIGYTVSVIAAHNRQINEAKKKEELEKAPKPQGFLGAVNEKVGNISATIKMVRPITSSYNDAPGSMVTMITDDNKEVVWYASKPQDLTSNQKVTIKSATVKKHGSYQGIDQTIVLRPKLEPIE